MRESVQEHFHFFPFEEHIENVDKSCLLSEIAAAVVCCQINPFVTANSKCHKLWSHCIGVARLACTQGKRSHEVLEGTSLCVDIKQAAVVRVSQSPVPAAIVAGRATCEEHVETPCIHWQKLAAFIMIHRENVRLCNWCPLGPEYCCFARECTLP